jgi:hypothetical protein
MIELTGSRGVPESSPPEWIGLRRTTEGENEEEVEPCTRRVFGPGGGGWSEVVGGVGVLLLEVPTVPLREDDAACSKAAIRCLSESGGESSCIL